MPPTLLTTCPSTSDLSLSVHLCLRLSPSIQHPPGATVCVFWPKLEVAAKSSWTKSICTVGKDTGPVGKCSKLWTTGRGTLWEAPWEASGKRTGACWPVHPPKATSGLHLCSRSPASQAQHCPQPSPSTSCKGIESGRERLGTESAPGRWLVPGGQGGTE